MTAARRLVPLDEIKQLAAFLSSVNKDFTFDSITVTGESVTFARLPENPTPVMVPNHGKKARTPFDEFYNTPTRD